MSVLEPRILVAFVRLKDVHVADVEVHVVALEGPEGDHVAIGDLLPFLPVFIAGFYYEDTVFGALVVQDDLVARFVNLSASFLRLDVRT